MFEAAFKDGLRFECTACSDCCTGSPGYVWLSEADISVLCAHFGHMSIEEFAASFCQYVKVEGGLALSLREKNLYDCIFLEKGRCSVYADRPIQCKTYPFWEEILQTAESWHGESRHCPGIGEGAPVSSERIADAVLLRRSNPPRIFPTSGKPRE